MRPTTRAGGVDPTDPSLVVLEGITKRFPGVLANDRVNLALRRGEIHALVGENGAGKSTLMRVLYGLYPPDAGRIVVGGEAVRLSSPRAAIARGIGMVHQHFVLVDRFTVVENVVLGAEGGPLLDRAGATARLTELAAAYGLFVHPDRPVASLSVGEQQRVEILKALYRGVSLLILDEPTAVLTPSEARELFANLRTLRDDGKTVVFISHKLDEVLSVADRITVLRRGRVVGETIPATTTKAELAELMVGRRVLFDLERPAVRLGPAALEVLDLEVAGRLHGLDLSVRAGEIVGVAGVEGNGQRELAECCIGLASPSAGSIVVDGVELSRARVTEHRRHGVSFVPEDRQGRGLVLDMSLWENTALGQQSGGELSGRLGLLAIRRMKERCARLIRRFDVRARSISASAATLSGGNQQKLILARELDGEPRVLVAHQPTRGLDVGAIEFVWRRILDQKAAGRAVLLISADLDEIYALSDRIVTMYEGRITGEFPRNTPTEAVGMAMTGRERRGAERR
jgi:general nucleoside transport system ATP-binding protein